MNLSLAFKSQLKVTLSYAFGAVIGYLLAPYIGGQSKSYLEMFSTEQIFMIFLLQLIFGTIFRYYGKFWYYGD